MGRECFSVREFRPSPSKAIPDEIDRVLATRYGFTAEESDFIPSIKLRAGINYDIKYRMGREEEADDPQKDADQ